MNNKSKVTAAILSTLILGASSVYAADMSMNRNMSMNKNVYNVQTGNSVIKIAVSKNGIPFVVGHNARIIRLHGQYIIREGNGKYFTLPIAKLKPGTVIATAKHNPSRRFEHAFHQRFQMKKAYIAGMRHGGRMAHNQSWANHGAMQHHNNSNRTR